MLEIIPSGHDATHVAPGDLIFCHRAGLVSSIIRLGERLRAGDARWSHVAVVVDDSPTRGPMVVEALTHGVERNPLSEYRDIEYAIVRTGLRSTDAEQAVEFARSCLGQSYGWLVILGIVLRYLTPGRGLWFGMDGTEICSGLAAQCMVRGWANYPVNPTSITPAELAAYYE